MNKLTDCIKKAPFGSGSGLNTGWSFEAKKIGLSATNNALNIHKIGQKKSPDFAGQGFGCGLKYFFPYNIAIFHKMLYGCAVLAMAFCEMRGNFSTFPHFV